MRKIVAIGFVVGISGLATAASAQDDAVPVDRAPASPPLSVATQAETGLASTYVFRGRPQYVSRQDASSQSTLAATAKSFGPGDLSLSAWNASALAETGAQAGNAIEVDLTGSYTMSFGEHLSATGGYIAYLFPQHLSSQTFDGAHELFAGLSVPNDVVTPSVQVNAEFVRMMGAYAAAGLSRTWTWDRLSLTPQASVGFAGYNGVAARMNDVSAMLTGQWNFYGPAYVNLRLAYSYLGGKASDLPVASSDSFSGRSAPWGMLALGVNL